MRLLTGILTLGVVSFACEKKFKMLKLVGEPFVSDDGEDLRKLKHKVRSRNQHKHIERVARYQPTV